LSKRSLQLLLTSVERSCIVLFMPTYEDFSDCRLDKSPVSFKARLSEDIETVRYHYVRLWKEISKDIKRGLRKPKSGRRYVANLSEHQAAFLKSDRL
jgi:hypothetical protein